MTEHYRCCTKPMHVRAYCVIKPFPVHTFGLALALSRRFNTHKLYWLKKQSDYDFARAASLLESLEAQP